MRKRKRNGGTAWSGRPAWCRSWAAAGIPVTHRGLSQGFCVLAGHVRPGDPRSSVDWAALARSGMTLVLLMAIDHLAAIAGALLAGGLGPGTPCAAVSDGWTRQQR